MDVEQDLKRNIPPRFQIQERARRLFPAMAVVALVTRRTNAGVGISVMTDTTNGNGKMERMSYNTRKRKKT